MDKYILVIWPEIQYFMESDRFHECLFVDNLDGHDEVPDSSYMVPEDLYDSMVDSDNNIWEQTLFFVIKSSPD